MKSRWSLLSVPVIAALVLVLATGASPAAPLCPSGQGDGANVLLRSGDVVLFSKGGEVYGCARANGVSRRLAPAGSIRFPQLAGSFVAFERHRGGPFAQVDVIDLSGVAPPRTQPGPGRIGSIALTSSGTVAWVSSARSGAGFEVHEASQQRNDLLDSGPRIDPGSLATSSDDLLLYWKRDGAAHAAPLR